MKKQPKSILLISVYAIAAGLVFMLAGFLGGAKFSSVTIEPNGFHLSDPASHTLKNLNLAAFKSINLEVSQSNIEFISSEHYGVDICYCGDTKPTYTLENGTLKISDTQNSSPKLYIMNFNSTQNPNTVKIYLPSNVSLANINIQSRLGSLKFDNLVCENTNIRLDFGELQMHSASCGNAKINLHNGSSTIQNVKVKNLSYENEFGQSNFESLTVDSTKDSTIKSHNGEISIKNLTSSGPLFLDDAYGSILVDGMAANSVKSTLGNGTYEIANSQVKDLTVENSYGGISISKLQSKGLNLQSGNGSISLEGELKGNSIIKSKYGEVNVKTSLPKNQYNYDFTSTHGNVEINGEKQEASLRQNSNAVNSLSIFCGNGDVLVDFQS